MATKITTSKDTKVAPKKCVTKKACAKKETAPKTCTTKKACAKKTVEAPKTCATKKACAKKETAPKACATKKACAKKETAPKKTCAKRACKKNAINKELSDSKLTMILAKTDIGWGNNLYIRGEGANLSWEKGVLMQSVSDNEWLWEAKNLKGTLSFKFLINDEIWCEGENIEAKINEIHTYYPEF